MLISSLRIQKKIILRVFAFISTNFCLQNIGQKAVKIILLKIISFFHKIKKKFEKKFSTKFWCLFTIEKWNFIILYVCLVKIRFFNFFNEKHHFLHTHALFGWKIIKIASFIAIIQDSHENREFFFVLLQKKLPVQNV